MPLSPLRYVKVTGALSVNGPAFVGFWRVRCKGLGIRFGAKPAHADDRQGRKIRCRVWLPK